MRKDKTKCFINERKKKDAIKDKAIKTLALGSLKELFIMILNKKFTYVGKKKTLYIKICLDLIYH